jgi:uncharacterized protein
MTSAFRTAAWLALITGILCSGAAHAGLNEGLEAVRKGDFATAVKELRPLADRGNAEAQYRVGLMYEFGRGYPADKAQGIVWFRKSADQGNAAAQQELGIIYATGDGVPKDDAQAVAWFQKAAKAGNAAAQFNLGLMVAKGTGVRRDDAQAVALFRKSAAQGFTAAQFRLGVAYEKGEGVQQNLLLAYACYAIAARDGYADYVAHRDELGGQLTPLEAQQGQILADAWMVGQPMPSMENGAIEPPASPATPAK